MEILQRIILNKSTYDSLIIKAAITTMSKNFFNKSFRNQDQNIKQFLAATTTVFLVVLLAISWLTWSRTNKYKLSSLKTELDAENNKVKSENNWSKKKSQEANLIEEGRHLLIPNKIAVLKPAPTHSLMQAKNFHITVKVANIYRNPSTDSERVTQALQGEPVKILNRRGSWLEVSLPDQFNYQGWLQESRLKNVLIDTDRLNHKIISVLSAEVRTLPSVTAPILVVLPMGAVVESEPFKANSNFISVRLVDGRKGYIVSTNLLDYYERDASQVSSDQIIETARQLLGQPYLWGGMTSSGVDCSGFVHTIFKVHGIRLHRDADLQYFHDGISVNREELQPGDLIFFETYKSGPSHVGIYVGNQKFLHATSSRGVSYGSLDERYFSQHFLGAKRVLIPALYQTNKAS